MANNSFTFRLTNQLFCLIKSMVIKMWTLQKQKLIEKKYIAREKERKS